MNRQCKQRTHPCGCRHPALSFAVHAANDTRRTAHTRAPNDHQHNAAMFDRADRNRDGQLTPDEARAADAIHGMWKGLDTNSPEGRGARDGGAAFRGCRFAPGSRPPA